MGVSAAQAWDKTISNLNAQSAKTSVLGNTVKTARGVTQILQALGQYKKWLDFPFRKAPEFVKYLSFVADFFKTINVIKGAQEITDAARRKADPNKPLDKHIRRLKIASGAFTLFVGSLTIVKLLEMFGAFKFASFTKAMGSTRFFGGVARALPFSSFVICIELPLAVLGITTSALKLKQMGASSEKIGSKIQFWKDAKLDAQFFADKEAKIEDKLKKLNDKEDTIKAEVDDLSKKVETSKTNLDAATGFFAKRKAKKEHQKNEKAFDLANKTSDATADKIEALGDKQTKIGYIRQALTTVDSDEKLGQVDQDKLDKFRADKLSKWNVKKLNLNWEKAKEGLSVAFNVVLTAALITSLVVTALGVGFFPLTVALTATFLFISIFSLTNGLIKDYKKPKLLPKVTIPEIEYGF